MPQSIQLIIDGPGAAPATAELLALPPLTLTEQPTQATATKGDPLTIAVAIVGIVGGTMTAAEQIRQWYNAWQRDQGGKAGKRLSKVVIELPDGQRHLMKNITTDELTKMLDAISH